MQVVEVGLAERIARDSKLFHCEYNKIIDVLQVHHKDKNRTNNELENLELLCLTCHAEEHFRFRGLTKS